MDHHKTIAPGIAAGVSRVFLALGAGLVLASCEFTALDEAVRGRSMDPPQFASTSIGSLELAVAQGSYGAMGTSIGQAGAPSFETAMKASTLARAAKSSQMIFGQAQANAGNFSRAMTSAWTDSTGSANEINAIGNAIRAEGPTFWNAVDIGYEPEIGASGFVKTDGNQALLAKAVGNPLSPFLGVQQRLTLSTPQIRMYHPSAGLSHMVASWPFAGQPVVGLNKRGLAMSVTATINDAGLTRSAMPFEFRSVLQSATSVEQAMRKLYAASSLDTAATVMLADRSGNVAHIECSLTRCVEVQVVLGEAGSSIHGAHHITSLGVAGLNKGTAPSQIRMQNLTNALSETTQQTIGVRNAVDILRSVAPSNAINDTVVANSQVTALVIVDPRQQTMWHSTGPAPFAAFSKIVEIGFDGPTGAEIPAINVNPSAGQALVGLGAAKQMYMLGNFQDALNALGQVPDTVAIDRRRIAYFRALVLSNLGQHQQAADFAATAASNGAQSNLQAHAHMLRAWNLSQIGDGQGQQRAMEMAAVAAQSGPVDRAVRHALATGQTISDLSQYPTLLLL